MATRKQRKRTQKERRHEQAWYQIDEFGNATEIEASEREETRSTDKSDSNAKQRPQQRASRATRTPLPPSWRRAAKRAGLLGIVIFVLFALLNAGHGGQAYVSALLLAVLYTVLFVPFTYYVDRFAYRRYLRREAEQPRKR